ncbi:CHASE3 domain-containing protein [Veronia nyctiphanis]|uniref:CHASE3 domain-containing protein n=1 Tax=Veronia nyctiphanis TaxID=1278244 RepID=UPI002E268092
METGKRGYLLAGKESFLEPYVSGKKEFSKLVSELKIKVSDNPSQVALLTDIETTISDWLANSTNPAIALRREIGDAKTMNDMADVISEKKGKQYFDRVRSLLTKFIAVENDLLQKRETTFSNASSSNNTESLDLVMHTYQVIEITRQIEASTLNMETGMRGYLLAGKAEFLEPYEQGKSDFRTLTSNLKLKVADNPSQVALLGEIESLVSEWQLAVVNPQISLRREIGDSKTMDDVSDMVAEARGKTYFDKFRSQIDAFIDREQTLMTARQQEAQQTVANVNFVVMLGMIVAVSVSIPLAIILSNSITSPFQNIFKGLRKFSTAELNQLSRAFTSIVQKMSNSAYRVSNVASNINNVSQNLSMISNRQASSVEQTSASTEEISGMLKVNVDSAEESRNLSRQMGEQMDELDVAMEKIAESNEKISALVKIIDEIGAKTEIIDEIMFQTKLLSFNASVEAVRAGEHGRGFAVVAQEVGNLAKRSGEAASDIASIVKQSVGEAKTIAEENTHRVESGYSIVSATRCQSKSVFEGANKVFEASNEQARGIQEISNAVESINKATQHAASMADQPQHRVMSSLVRLKS